MSARLFRRSEQRNITHVPWNVGAPNANNEGRALGLTPVFAAVRHITDYGSTLPLKPYRKVGDERFPMSMPQLFAQMQASGQLIPWLSQALASLVLRGNAVGLITGTDGLGFPTNVAWLSMDRVYVDDSAGVGKWYVDGRPVSRLDLVHIPWIVLPGHTLGLSPMAYYAATVNAGLGAQAFGSDWFKGGGFPPAVFRNTFKTLKPGAADTIRERLVASIRRHEPLVTGKDWEYQPITIPPGEAQFIESQKLSANQIAAIYGIEPDEIGGEAANSLTYSTEEHRQIKRLANLRPYLVRFETAFSSWLPSAQYVRFNGDAIVRADLKTRWEVHQIRHSMGAASIDEIRTTEDESPLPNGQGQAYGPPKPAPAPAPIPQDPGAVPRRLTAVPTPTEAHYE